MAQEVATPGLKPDFQIDRKQIKKACKALLAHVNKTSAEEAANAPKKNLLGDENDVPIWVTLTTKHHIKDSNLLKPHRVELPHRVEKDPDATICLIVADPQRTYKDIIASEEFPAALRERITRVIDLTHLKAKFKQYEAQRKLFSEHDIFLADDRIITRLPKALGKTFYRSQAKRPIPVVLRKRPAPPLRKRNEGGAKDLQENKTTAKPPAWMAQEIHMATGCALVNLSPSTNTAIKAGFASWDAKQLAQNVEVLVDSVVSKYVPNRWDNVRSVFVKGPETAALPLYEADELWLDAEKDIVADGSEAAKLIEAKKEKSGAGKKRKPVAVEEANDAGESSKEKQRTPKKVKTAAALPESNDDKLDREIAERKERLKKQKSAAKDALDD